MPTDAPRAPLPPRLRSNVPGTWAFDTMSRRVRTDILARVFRENDELPQDALDKLRLLDSELADAASTPLTRIPDDGGHDVSRWNNVLLTEILRNSETWLSAPWCDAEFYFYRRIMAAVDWFNTGVDPFRKQKQLGLDSAMESVNALGERVLAVVSKSNFTDDDLRAFVLTALWGNRMDLSLWPVGSGRIAGDADFSNVIASGTRMILADNSDSVVAYAMSISKSERVRRMDIIVDNAGFELFTDLCLADILVTSGAATVVHLQLKGHPTFVSDAMRNDVQYTIEQVQPALGARWKAHIAAGRWVLVDNLFWCEPTAFWEMPNDVENDMRQSCLVFIKGDANYRRLLGDRAWPLATPFADIACYFPAPICALRTLKAELGCGMSEESTTNAAAEDDQWLVAGKFGVVQFLNTNEVQ